MKGIRESMKLCGTVRHEATALWSYFMKDSNGQVVGLSLGVLANPNQHWRVATNSLRNMKELFAFNRGKSSNDAIGFRKTVLMAVSPTVSPEGADATIVKQYNNDVDA